MLDQLMAQVNEQKEAGRKKLDTMFVSEQAENGLVKVTMTGNKKVTNIEISPTIADDKETIEDLVIVAVNKAIIAAEKLHEQEMGNIANGLMGGSTGISNLLGKM